MRQVDQAESTVASHASARPPVVAPDVQDALLALARVALAAATGRSDVSTLDVALRTCRDGGGRGAVFVTLFDRDELRGCIGSLDTHLRLRDAVVIATVDAARDDPRFVAVDAGEVPAMRIVVSVLGPCIPLTDPGDLEPGLDGVVVDRGGRRGLLLPEVATEHGWGAPELLAAACCKAGLPADAWMDPGTGLRTFRTVRFGGPAVMNDDVRSSTRRLS